MCKNGTKQDLRDLESDNVDIDSGRDANTNADKVYISSNSICGSHQSFRV